MRDAPRAQPPNRACEQPEALAALVARAEEELQADADPRHRPPGGDALAQRVVEPVAREPRGRALDVTDARDQRERRLAHEPRVDGHDRLHPGPRERRRERAEVAGPVVGEHDPHAAPFVERIPASPGATACRSAWPSAL